MARLSTLPVEASFSIRNAVVHLDTVPRMQKELAPHSAKVLQCAITLCTESLKTFDKGKQFLHKYSINPRGNVVQFMNNIDWDQGEIDRVYKMIASHRRKLLEQLE